MLLDYIGDRHRHATSVFAASIENRNIYRPLRIYRPAGTRKNGSILLTQKEDSIGKVAAEVTGCSNCRLCQNRRNAVPGEGSATPKVVFVGEAPGEQEDIQGRPFVGAAGKLLTELLRGIGLRREDVFITNVVKCRPPNNRPPRKDEVAACNPYLERQFLLLMPKLVCPMGNSAIHSLIETEKSVTDLHGVPLEVGGITYFPMYHPAAALYTFQLRRVLEEDFGKLRALLDSIVA